METNTLNEMAVENVITTAETVTAEVMSTQPGDNMEASADQPADLNADGPHVDPNDPNHRHHHTSAIHAAHLGHSAVGHVLPHHRGIDL